MTRLELIAEIKKKQSFLCVGLDPELDKIPTHLLQEEDPIFAFNKAIIDATNEYCVAYKPNIAFYESLGSKGWESLNKTLQYIPKNCFTIADAKRGDIGNTSKKYAETFFNTFPFDSITINPYMGNDAVKPYLEYPNKWAIVLGLTSNQGAADFQLQQDSEGKYIFETNIEKIASWGNDENTMFVVGATQKEYLQKIRAIIPHHFLLVPGIGAQGGSLEDVVTHCWNVDCGLLINSSRGIIYAGNRKDFAAKSKMEAQKIQQKMAGIISEKQF